MATQTDDPTEDEPVEEAASTGSSATDAPPDRGSGVRGLPRGICKVCGEPAYSPSALYCDEHRDQAAGARLTSDGKPRPPRPGAGKMPAKVATQLETDLRVNLEMIGQLWAMRDPFCGSALCPKEMKFPVVLVNPQTGLPQTGEIEGGGAAGEIARFWVDQAQRNPYVRHAVEAVGSGGGIAGAVMAGFAVHRPLLIAVWAHHVQPALDARRIPNAESEVTGETVTGPLEPEAADGAVSDQGGEYGAPWGPPPPDEEAGGGDQAVA